MHVEQASDATSWDALLAEAHYRPFLQSWTMGEVYRECGESPIRLVIREGDESIGICQAIIVNAKRGRHLIVPYGPVFCRAGDRSESLKVLLPALKEFACEHHCSFIRMSPFLAEHHSEEFSKICPSLPSPLHLLAEHLWYLPLSNPDPWEENAEYEQCWNLGEKNHNPNHPPQAKIDEETLLASMRKTTRNLIRRAEKEGVTIERSSSPLDDLQHFIALHDETRKRHRFTPYSNAFFRAQVKHFSARSECTLYLARYQANVIAASIHMHAFGETSYHHGASSHVFQKIPGSTLLQWTAIRDALKRHDRVYNFWGIAPQRTCKDSSSLETSPHAAIQPNHPFAGVTLFKTGFGGKGLNLMHCRDIPVRSSYYLTRGFEIVRKWKRGF